jgi:hypothetical protein
MNLIGNAPKQVQVGSPANWDRMAGQPKRVARTTGWMVSFGQRWHFVSDCGQMTGNPDCDLKAVGMIV